VTMSGDRLLPRTTAHPVAQEDGPAPDLTAATNSRPSWERRLALWIGIADASAVLAATAVSVLLRIVLVDSGIGGMRAAADVAALTAGWVVCLHISDAYGAHVLGAGAEEYKRVLTASWRFAAVLAVGSYAFRYQLSRGFLLLAVPAGAAALVAVRAGGHRYLRSLHARGVAVRRVLVVGPAHAAAHMIRQLQGDPSFRVVSVCTGGLVQDGVDEDSTADIDVREVIEALRRVHADTVAVAGTNGLPDGFLARLAWMLGGTGVDVLVPPAITDAVGPRIHLRPAARLSMLYVDEPELRGVARFAKGLFDRVLAGGLLVVLSPVLLVIAAVIKLTSPGNVLFRQRRAGQAGEYFGIWKFRTMHADADQFSSGYDLSRELAVPGLKQADDPRVTRVGRVLRQTSLDELPQLLNVALGQMSLVGPRPILKHEVDSFDHHELRRHLVKPGMTGLWQVSGRSDIEWEERIRLDLYYVEHWSPLLDLAIIMRTLSAVVRRAGAY
jgi:exopolysaccharide biosynthesis polyprenyl glycosylphosphotransferase